MQDNFAKWLFRIVAVLGAIGFIVTYSVRHDWSKGALPSLSDDYRPPEPPAAPPVAAAAPVAPAPQAVAPAAALAPPASTDGAAYAPCQPIGRTAKGELVYSMDCRRPPAP